MALTRVKSKGVAHSTGGAGGFLPPGSEDRRWFAEPGMGVPVLEVLGTAKERTANALPEVAKEAKERTGARVVIAKDGMFATLERRPTVDRAWVVWVSDGGPMIELVVVEKGEDREKILAEVVKKHGGAK